MARERARAASRAEAGGAAGATSTGGRGGAASAGGRGGDAGGATPGDLVTTFHNGGFWTDTTGKRIEAHGGGLIKVGDTWYWVGEDKSHNAGTFRGVNIYASKDLGNWELRNAIITRSSAPDLMASDRIIERPKIVFNDATGQFVMWLHWEGQNYATAEAGVFTSPTIDGNYTLRSHFRPANNMSRDDTLFKDDDGKAYFISAANENADLMLYELADDYLSIRRTVLRLWTTKREAPAMFKQNGRYFIITSAATGWDPEPGAIFVGDQHRRSVGCARQPGQRHHLRHATDVCHSGAGVAGHDVHLCGRSLAGPRPAGLEVHLAAAEGQRHDAVARQLQRLAAERDHRPLVRERRLPATDRLDVALCLQRGDVGENGGRQTRSTTRRRRSGTPSTRAPRPRTRTRSRSISVRATRWTVFATCRGRTRIQTARSRSTSSMRAPTAPTGVRRSRRGRSARIAARSA